MKNLNFLLVLGLCFMTTISMNAQNKKDIKRQTKIGDCLCAYKNDNGEYNYKSMDCDLMYMTNEEVKTLQYKLKNYGYDVDITGKRDDKTIAAYDKEKKYAKKRLRLRKKAMRKRKNKAINLNK